MSMRHMVVGEQQMAGQQRHSYHGCHRHGAMEGDGGGTQQTQVQGSAPQKETWVALLEEAVIVRHIAH